MKLLETLDIRDGEIISIVGGGGKTSTMFSLAKELSERGKKVLVTTTTAIMMPETSQYHVFLDKSKGDNIESAGEGGSGIYLYIKEFIRSDKLKGIDEREVDSIGEKGYFDNIIVEADGAKRKPIKAPREGEPLIPSSTNKVIGVIGLDSLGLEIDDENVHRANIFAEITDSNIGDVLTPKVVYSLISSRSGLFKNAEGKKKYLILNKADNSERVKLARKIITYIDEADGVEKAIITSFKNGEIIV